MHNKNIGIAFALVCTIAVAGFFIVSSKKHDQQNPPSLVDPSENISTTTQEKKLTWKEYHNEIYGYVVSYTDDLITQEDEDGTVVGADSAGFGWFSVQATTTLQTIEEYITTRNTSEFSKENPYIILRETNVSGYSAVVTHIQNTYDKLAHDANLTLLVKKGDILFSFYVRGNEEYNEIFINSVRFDK